MISSSPLLLRMTYSVQAQIKITQMVYVSLILMSVQRHRKSLTLLIIMCRFLGLKTIRRSLIPLVKIFIHPML